ncbi:glycosyltransferase 8 domain-containing protein 2-like [Oscarella lobularis]|uniref:glycosyltransferase 8 domain-containing protein 2-like n=1 Tax=Oscarella lobularis TaxID=121494 RepID=UPI00331326E1
MTSGMPHISAQPSMGDSYSNGGAHVRQGGAASGSNVIRRNRPRELRTRTTHAKKIEAMIMRANSKRIILLILGCAVAFVAFYGFFLRIGSSESCTHNGRFLEEGESTKEDCKTCQCSKGTVTCLKDPSCDKDPIIIDYNVADVHVMICADSPSLMGLIALVNSIRKNTNATVMYHLVTDDKTVHHLKEWIERTELSVIKRNIIVFNPKLVEGEIIVRGYRKSLASPLNYARLFLPQLLPNFNGRLVYIDADCIVQGDVRELAKTYIAKEHWAAFSDDCSAIAKRFNLFQNSYVRFLNYANQHVQKLGIPPDTCSFNTGVFVTDVFKWRENSISEKLEEWNVLNVKENLWGGQSGGGASQPPVMIVFHQKYSRLDPLWHVRHLGWSAGSRYSRHFLSEAKLVHWNGQFKPWGNPSQYHDMWDKYFVSDPLGEQRPVRKYKT